MSNRNDRNNISADSHTVRGIKQLSDDWYNIIIKRFIQYDQSLYQWEDDSGKCNSMFEMSNHLAPERYLIEYQRIAFFDFEGDTHALPLAQNYLVNIYGCETKWHVIGNGNEQLAQILRNLELNHSNSVICLNSLSPESDIKVFRNCATMMIDAMMTLYQRSLLSRSPFIFTIQGHQDSRASNFMNAILNYSPWITQGEQGVDYATFNTQTTIDTGLIDLVSYWESFALTYMGYDCTDIHKRAQQSVPETLMSQDKIQARRKEKLRCRQNLCDEYNRKFGNNLKVYCVLDEVEQEELLNDIENTLPKSYDVATRTDRSSN